MPRPLTWTQRSTQNFLQGNQNPETPPQKHIFKFSPPPPVAPNLRARQNPSSSTCIFMQI